MTPSQEAKLDALNATCIRMEGKFNLIDEKQTQHREAILDQEKQLIESKKRIDGLDGDRNKVIGAMWVACSSAFIAAFTFVISWIRK